MKRFLRVGFVTVAIVSLGGATFLDDEAWAPMTPDMSAAPGLERHEHPSLVIIGMAKSGTTSSYSYIVNTFQSDLFSIPLKKESNFLASTMDFTPEAVDSYRRQLNVSADVPFSIDASPGYAHRGVTVTGNLRALNKKAVVILQLREPVSRARSFFNYIYRVLDRMPYGNRTFEDVMQFELDAFEAMEGAKALLETITAHNNDADAAEQAIQDLNLKLSARAIAAGRGAYEAQSLLISTTYTACMARWRPAFVPGRVLVLQSEFFSSNPAAVLRQVMHPLVFGGRGQAVSSEPLASAQMQARWKPREPRRHSYAAEAGLPPALACRMQRFFEPFVTRVREQLVEATAFGVAYVAPLPNDPEAWWRTADYCTKAAILAAENAGSASGRGLPSGGGG